MAKQHFFTGLKNFILLFSLVIFFTGCSKDDDECTKTITVPELKVGGAYYPAYKMEVPCDFEEPGPLEPTT